MHINYLEPRLYENVAPLPRDRERNNPTLLVCWWCTCMSVAIIIARLWGRLIRTERLFREDMIMATSIIPLMARMACVHVILIYGTNNVNPAGLTDRQISHRIVGAKLVLVARIMYAAFIWVAKFTVSEFLKRITTTIWRKSYELVLRGIRVFLVVTFFAVVIATLAECQPFEQYWQVVPLAPPKCRQGYAHLLTMGICDIVTDVFLVAFPIPLVLKSSIPVKRKITLVLLFSLSLGLIGVTGYRMPSVINRDGLQQFRSLVASLEILAAAAVSNAIVIGSFLRDRGVKKAKFKFGSATDSMDRPSTRRTTVTQQQWGSDEDLIRGMGYRLGPEFEQPRESNPRPAGPVAYPGTAHINAERKASVKEGWNFPSADSETTRGSSETDLKAGLAIDPMPSPREIRAPAKRNVSFFDVGGLLEDGKSRSAASLAANSALSSTDAQDFAIASPQRRGSRSLLSDMGALIPTIQGRPASKVKRSEDYEMSQSPRIPHSPTTHSHRGPPSGVVGPQLARNETLQSLQDVGGLLSESQADALNGPMSPISLSPMSPSTPVHQSPIEGHPSSHLESLSQPRRRSEFSLDPPPSYPQARRLRAATTSSPSSSPEETRSGGGPNDLQDVGGLLKG